MPHAVFAKDALTAVDSCGAYQNDVALGAVACQFERCDVGENEDTSQLPGIGFGALLTRRRGASCVGADG